ncbi:hypothetical protein RchiOBHm_Chr5g0053681 [Rosa chinensis]|uniref:Uncharacterized protein n=1 Tax=Rosa chinensis TaxID=74649 RepID=A0A2P6QFY7_ROSCH|nr:hypothetical protein RchiOBHm_Chr5g0053681 [Rosa chinensis]
MEEANIAFENPLFQSSVPSVKEQQQTTSLQTIMNNWSCKLLDAVTYTSFFVFAFLGYEKSTGKNPAANIKALIGIVHLMWDGK